MKRNSFLASTDHLSASLIFRFAVLALISMSATVQATTTAIEGVVQGPKGHLICGAEVRIEATGGSRWNKVVKTDATGHYVYAALSAGTYRVSLTVNGSVRASINNVKTSPYESTKLNFNLKGSDLSSPKKKPTHMVWLPSETGSHIGGRWVEVDDSGNADTTGAQNVQKVSGDALREIQSNSSVMRPQPGGSH